MELSVLRSFDHFRKPFSKEEKNINRLFQRISKSKSHMRRYWFASVALMRALSQRFCPLGPPFHRYSFHFTELGFIGECEQGYRLKGVVWQKRGVHIPRVILHDPYNLMLKESCLIA